MHTLLYNVALLAAQFKLWHNVNTAEMMGVHSWGLVPNRLATELLGELNWYVGRTKVGCA